jgi:M6 family metalloprotease-like protein
MSRRALVTLVMVLLATLLMTPTSHAQPPGSPHGGPGGYDTPPTQAFEEFTIRIEPELGSPRCPENQQDADHCKPAEWLSTRSQNFVNIQGKAFLRGSSEITQGVQVTSSFVASQNDTDVAIQFSAEAYVEDDNAGADRRMFVRALVDGVAVNPSDVVFATTTHQGTQSFIFTTKVSAGIHTVEMQWKVDTEATAFLRDASLLVRMGRDDASEKGTLTVKTAPSGPNLSTKSKAWTDVPNMSLSFYSPKSGQVTASFSAEAWASNGKRMMLRALLDGAPMNPGDVVFVKNSHPSSQAMTFGLKNVSSGWHTVTMQWSAEAEGVSYMGDRTLAVSALPVRGDAGSHQFIAAPSGENKYTLKGISTPLPVPDMALKFEIPAKGNGEVAVQFSAEAGATDGADVIAVLVIDGELQLEEMVQLADGSQAAQVKSYVFEAKRLAPGMHTAEIWFASGSGGQAYVGDRTMSLMSATGFIPDLAEAPKFNGGHIGQDYLGGVEPLIGTRKVLAILIDPGFCEGTIDPQTGDPCYQQLTIPKGKVDAAIFGTSAEPGWGAYQPNNIAAYLDVNSGGRFTILRGGPGIAGWYDTDKPWQDYYEHDGSCTDGFDTGGDMLHSEAVSHADGAVDFATFDVNGDGQLSTNELGIVVIIPRADGDGSQIQPLYGSTCGANTRLNLDGVDLPPRIVKWNTSLDEAAETYQFTTGAHEIMHLLAGMDDLYRDSDTESADNSVYPRELSIMADGRWTTTHLDGFQKLALGWATPVIVGETGQVTVSALPKSNVVYILPRYNNPWAEEFYLLENRQADMAGAWFDDGILDSGIAVWHIVTDPVANQLKPVGTSQHKWDITRIPGDNPTSQGQMARNGIRLLRPFDDIVDGDAVFDDKNHTLWSAADYDLQSDDCVLIAVGGAAFRQVLAWADCVPSGYSLDFVDPVQENMRVNVTVK